MDKTTILRNVKTTTGLFITITVHSGEYYSSITVDMWDAKFKAKLSNFGCGRYLLGDNGEVISLTLDDYAQVSALSVFGTPDDSDSNIMGEMFNSIKKTASRWVSIPN